MAGERKAIRDQFKLALAAGFSGDIYTKRFVDGRELREYVNVYFGEAAIEYDGLKTITQAELIIGYHTIDYVDDDALDVIADLLYLAVENADIAADVISGVLPSGFEYGEEQENEFTSIFLKFTVIY